AGNPVTTRLSAGAQMISNLATLFGFDRSNPTTGSFTVASDRPTVIGDLMFGDFSFQQMSRASVPLVAASYSNAIIPYADNGTPSAITVNIANPSGATAAVTVTSMDSTGKQTGSTTLSVPANGFSTAKSPINSGGYTALASTQPIVAFGVVAPTAG